jgi:hypothetical protein
VLDRAILLLVFFFNSFSKNLINKEIAIELIFGLLFVLKEIPIG